MASEDLNFKTKADKMVAALSRLLPNMGDPVQQVLRLDLYVNTMMSVLLFEVPVWARAMEVN